MVPEMQKTRGESMSAMQKIAAEVARQTKGNGCESRVWLEVATVQPSIPPRAPALRDVLTSLHPFGMCRSYSCGDGGRRPKILGRD